MNRARLLLAALLVAASAVPAAEEAEHSAHAAPAPVGHAAHSGEGVAPVPPLTDTGPAHSRLSGHEHHDNDIQWYLLFDQFEYHPGINENGLAWETSGWLGTDIDRLWLRSDGARSHGAFESAGLEALYGRSISAWWDVLAGVRRDFEPGADRTWAAVGLQGLAPLRFEVAATAYVRSGGHTAARFEADCQLRFTNRLILQPVLDVWLHGRDDAARGVGAGLSTVEAGLRLRYEFTRRFGPYLGFELERAFGDTASFRRAAGGHVTDMHVVTGLRTWF